MSQRHSLVFSVKRCSAVVLSLVLLLSTALFADAAPRTKADGAEKAAPSIETYLVLNRNTTYQLCPTVNGVNADPSNYTYTISNRKVAQIDSSGLITTRKKGSARITIASRNNSSIYCTTRLYVGKKITRIRLTTAKKTILAGNYFMLKAKLSPGGAAYKKLEYTSSDTSVATVSSKGKVTGIAPGNTTITVRTLDGSNLSRTCTITVLSEPSSSEQTSVFPNPFFRNSKQSQTQSDTLSDTAEDSLSFQ